MQEDKVAAWARASFCGDHSASAEELEGATLWSRRRREATCTRSPQRAVFPCFSPYGLCWPQTQQLHRRPSHCESINSNRSTGETSL